MENSGDSKNTFSGLSVPLKIGFALGITCNTICAFDKFIAEFLKLVSLVRKNIIGKRKGR